MINDNKGLVNYWPKIVFGAVLCALAVSILCYSPSWGLQDDVQNLGTAEHVWQSDHFLSALWGTIKSDLASWGIFRPVYYSSVVITYHFFKDMPWLIYILLAIFNFVAMFFWGVVISKMFAVKKNQLLLSTFLFPLSFLLFTPFWNIFVHISFQEKYIVFFSALSLYFLERAYCKEKIGYLIPTVAFMVLGILSKPTGIYLAMTYIVFAVADLVFIKYKKRISLWVLLINMILFVFYYWFITNNLRGYAGQYSLSGASIINNLSNSSIIVKSLIATALIMGTWSFILILRKKNNFSPLVLTIPLGFLSYVLVLAPWHFASYLLSALTPYALIMFFPVYIWLNNKNSVLKNLTNICLILLVTISFLFIAIPRISKLTDIKNVEKFISNSNENTNVYFFPPPFSEAAEAISRITKAKIIFLHEGQLTSEKLQSNKEYYLIVNDEVLAVKLDRVAAGKRVYQNNTWEVFHLVRNNQSNEVFKVDFPENPVEKFKSLLRDF